MAKEKLTKRVPKTTNSGRFIKGGKIQSLIALNNTGGRPILFKPEYTKMLDDFFTVEPYRKEIMRHTVKYNNKGEVIEKSEDQKYVPNKLPTLSQFARNIGVDYTTVWEWAEKGEHGNEFLTDKPEKYSEEQLIERFELKKNISQFAKAFARAKQSQKDFLIQNGLMGTTPPQSYIFTAKNITDMRDKVESEVTISHQITGIKITEITSKDITNTLPEAVIDAQLISNTPNDPTIATNNSEANRAE